MGFINGIHSFPVSIRIFIFFFTLTLTLGYLTGLKFISKTTNLNPEGLEQNYLGNEEDEDAQQMMFRKSEREILTTIHNHILSFSLIFLSLGTILLTLPINQKIRNLLLIEPFVSIIVTFGGIWLLWKGFSLFKYIVIFSGTLISVTFFASVLIIYWHILLSPRARSKKEGKLLL